MYLKQLSLQGYKSFATKTEFEFNCGITAIVGPNGSGKSNIADAVRWVLGEQSYSTLRAKRTEDMIFAGGPQRARVGLAQASITLDNTSGWLPVDYSEVTITRRAYRSGENEYWLNGNRVRLRDITELLAARGLNGSMYTVISQGLVDVALSLRPTERRRLFEEAAGISVYQAKRDSALAKLQKTQDNILRINDIINEIAPRLKRLEGQAAKAREYADVTHKLAELLQTWYGYQWQMGLENRAQAESLVEERKQVLSRQREKLCQLQEDLIQNQRQEAELRESLGQWRLENAQLIERRETARRQLAVGQERLRLNEQWSEEIGVELARLEGEEESHRARMEGSRKKLQQLENEARKLTGQLKTRQAELAQLEKRKHDGQEELERTQQRAFQSATNLAEARNRLTQLAERRQELEREESEHNNWLTEHRAERERVEQRLKRVEQDLQDLASRIDTLQSQRSKVEKATLTNQENQGKLESSLREAERELEGLQARYEVMRTVHHEVGSHQLGAQAILEGASQGKLTGVVGTVQSLMKVPARFEPAIGAALGPRLQSVVVEGWPDVERGIQYLKDTEGGQATFVPLDSLAPRHREEATHAPQAELKEHEGVVGLALDLVKFNRKYGPLFATLLGQVLVVKDLATARSVSVASPCPFSKIVTLSGEVVEPGGAVTGGSRGGYRGSVLAQEKLWPELPQKIAAAQEKKEKTLTKLEEEREREQRLRQERDHLRREEEELAEIRRAKLVESEAVQQEGRRLTQEEEWRTAILHRIKADLSVLKEKRAGFQAEIERLEQERTTVAEEVLNLKHTLEALDLEEMREEIGRITTAQAVLQENIANQKTVLESQEDDLGHLQAQLATTKEKKAELEEEAARLTSQIAELEEELEVLTQSCHTIAHQIETGEKELMAFEKKGRKLEEKQRRQQQRVQKEETRHRDALLRLERSQDHLMNLQQQIETDLDLVEVTTDLPKQLPLNIEWRSIHLPSLTVIPRDLRERIKGLRRRLRSIGPVNPDAPAEYEEALERHRFLTSQVQDLEEGARSLKEVVRELDRLMEERFKARFEAINETFQSYFTALFDGGAAQLVLTEPHDILTTGVEITVQPPGKRRQTLSALSGGERALTAVALIFAILKVSEVPFCLLDEVDATLDEVNIGRFRRTLEELAHNIQFIVITHNRGTIEAAETIYGISMEEDGVSKVLSMRLEDEDNQRRMMA